MQATVNDLKVLPLTDLDVLECKLLQFVIS